MKPDGLDPIPYIITPSGKVLTKGDLSSRNTKRWVLRRKGEIVAAVCGGLISLEDACIRYGLTTEEFSCWQRALARVDRLEPSPKQASFDEEMDLVLHQAKCLLRS